MAPAHGVGGIGQKHVAVLQRGHWRAPDRLAVFVRGQTVFTDEQAEELGADGGRCGKELPLDGQDLLPALSTLGQQGVDGGRPQAGL